MNLDNIFVNGVLKKIKSDVNYCFHYRGKGFDSENENEFFVLSTLIDTGLLKEASRLVAVGQTGQREIMVVLTAEGERLLQDIN